MEQRTLKLKIACFPWAGGTSRLYQQWVEAFHSSSFEVIPLELPGRNGRAEEAPLENLALLADRMTEELKPANKESRLILFGHSFGGVLAFECAKRLEVAGHPPLAVFISACRPPQAESMVDKPISQLPATEIRQYFSSRGFELENSLVSNTEALNLFLNIVKADYKCLETYTDDGSNLTVPLYIIGGSEDPGISVELLSQWTSRSTHAPCPVHVFNKAGHYFLTDASFSSELIDYVKSVLDKYDPNVPAVNEVVDKVIRIFCDVLDLDLATVDVTSTSNFFHLGGTSLDTMALTVKIKSVFGLHVTQDEFMLHPSVERLAKRIRHILRTYTSGGMSTAVAISRALNAAGDTKWYPASFGQSQMLVLHQTAPGQYNMPTTIEFLNGADISVVRRVCTRLADQHESLRTAVKLDPLTDEAVQCVLLDAETAFEVTECYAATDDECRLIIEADSVRPFDLAQPPFARALVIQKPDKTALLLLNQHHVGSDGWSRTQLRQQLLQGYLRLKDGHNAAPPEYQPTKAIDYLDWSEWQRKYLLDHGKMQEQLSYWKSELRDLSVLDLPNDYPRPPILSSQGARIRVEIDPDTSERFRSMIAKEDASAFVGLLSMYIALLGRWSRVEGFAVGVAMANRHHEGLEKKVGYFANEVSIYADLHSDPSFAEVLARIREKVIKGMGNADAPFHKVVEALSIERDRSRTTVFQAMFALQERAWHTLEHISPQFRLRQFEHNTSKFEVHLQLRDDGKGGYEGDFHFSTDLFSRRTGQAFVDAYKLLLKQVTQQPTTSIRSISLVSERDYDTINASNATEETFPTKTINAMIEDVNASRTALISAATGETMSYGVLRSSVRRVAMCLGQRTDYTNPSRVLLFLSNSTEAIIGIIGVLRADHAYILIDPAKTPPARIKQLVTDSGAYTIITNTAGAAALQGEATDGLAVTVVNITDVLSNSGSSEVALTLRAEMTDVDMEFGLFYTSGTTGKPKGVINTHGNALNLVNWWRAYFPVVESDRVLLFSSLSFIMSVRQWLPTLCTGASLVIPASGTEFEKAIVTYNVNKLILTPSALSALDSQLNTIIDAIQVAGEAPSLQVLQTWQRRVPRVLVGLGPTEMTAHCLCGEFDGHVVSVGHPAANTKVYVVDPRSRLQQPVSLVGEMWVYGASVSLGYANQPAVTAESFEATNPFAALESANGTTIGTSYRMYKTGDLAKRLPDGRIQFIGRQDNQMKVAGFRIEPQEISNAMPQEVTRSHIAIFQGRLVAFVAPDVDASHVSATLRACLPTYAVPSTVVCMPALPLNKNGKVNAPLLLKDLAEATILAEETTKDDDTLSPTEFLVRQVFAQILGRPPGSIPSDSNFFALGGTSLTAVIASRKLGKELDTDLSANEIFQNQTVGELSKFISQSKGENFQQLSRTPPPLLYLHGGEKAMSPTPFAICQLVGICIVTVVVGGPLAAMLFLLVRCFTWYGLYALLLFPLVIVGGMTLHLALVLLCKWAIIGRYREGKAKVFSWYFLKWWLMRRILRSSNLYIWIADETIASSAFQWLLGASIATGVSLESPIMSEADLVMIGEGSVVEYDAQFATCEVKDGCLNFRSVVVGNNCRIGARAVLQGGAVLHSSCDLGPKGVVDFRSTSTGAGQILRGAPSKVVGQRKDTTERWRPNYGGYSWIYFLGQLCFSLVILLMMEACFFLGVFIALIIDQSLGRIAAISFTGTFLSIIIAVSYLLLVAVARFVVQAGQALLPDVQYSGLWFCLRKWFIDRLLLSPTFNYASRSMLQASSTHPGYLWMLGATVGKRAWINVGYLRMGLEMLEIGSECHLGLDTYFQFSSTTATGVTFARTKLGHHSSFGQRCVCLQGVRIGDHATVGAETAIHESFSLDKGASAFGSPLVVYKTSLQNQDVVDQTQAIVKLQLAERASGASFKGSVPGSDKRDKSFLPLPQGEDLHQSTSASTQATTRAQDIGKGNFWVYFFVTLLVQGLIPVLILGCYGGAYYAVDVLAPENLRAEVVIITLPLIYFVGCGMLIFLLWLFSKLGQFHTQSGNTNFFSARFLMWHLFADAIYLCTSTVLYPLSGTEVYNAWFRLMGAKVGKRVFISPENGGFREIDFLHCDDDSLLLTPNIHAHYTDHNQLQFCPVDIGKGVTINVGATIMPLTVYEDYTCLRPFTVTIKGQTCEEPVRYWGNPAVRVPAEPVREAMLFPGQGAQYTGMFDSAFLETEMARQMLATAKDVLGFDVMELTRGPEAKAQIQQTEFSQPLIFIASLLAAQQAEQSNPLDIAKVVAVAGFSLGEITALVFAGALSFPDGLRLVKTRSEAMAACSGGSMCNVRGISRGTLERLCRDTGCSIANSICDPSEEDEGEEEALFVCGGSAEGIEGLVKRVKALRKEAKLLRVSGAFHTAQMKPATAKLREMVRSLPMILPTKYLIYSNVTGHPYRSVREMRQRLVEQICSPVEWYKTIRDLLDNEKIEAFIECGPMDQLSKMLAVISPSSRDNVINFDIGCGRVPV